MKKVTYKNIHNFFKFNGVHFDSNGLRIAAYYLIKEGNEQEKAIGDFLLDWFDENPYIDLKTSGTTGVPKIIRKSKQALVNSALATGDFFELKPGDSALCCLPVQFIAGKMMLVRSFILGLAIDVVSPNSHPLATIDKEYDFVAMVPLQVQNSLNELHKVKKLIIGGAKMANSLENKLLNVSTKVYETYGMTETITHIAAKKIGERAFSILPNVSISQNENDCLVIDAPQVSEERLFTNDLVQIINDNQFVLLGRIDNVVNSGGVKLIPEKIEEKLADAIAARFFVGGIPDADLGEKLVLLVEGEKQELDESIFAVLDKYEKPKAVFFVPEFDTTESGKIKRKAILTALE
ncbi:O-succinylbenzoic acid--CoA ligase [Flavobacterium sufflavum]|uniref:O-succinylbenzoic acid--CoA ligase n=1 Tax=Flavobacterium sufflavum TaxID=1921138 RepID=A0A437KVR3_9FLAO|nr:AMP-binding protein [Flavobacterium sufflavum]RVT76494.1 O-succinylbenzoic acid--CoA ligase [Flavobacterium sufflavum]